MATIRAPLTTGLGNEQGMGWVGSAIPVVPIGYGGQQGLISHHLNPYLTPEGNVTVEGLQKARENQFNETGQPLGTGWGEPSGAELQQIIEGQNQSSNVPTSITQSATAFPIGNMGYGPLIAQEQTNLLNPFQLVQSSVQINNRSFYTNIPKIFLNVQNNHNHHTLRYGLYF